MPDAVQAKSSYAILRTDLGERLSGPPKQVAWLLYAIVAIIVVGGLGAWIAIIKLINETHRVSQTWLSVPQNLATYAMSILVTAGADFMLSKVSASMRMFAFSTIVIGALLALLGMMGGHSSITYIASVAATILALFLWWISCPPDRFSDGPGKPEAATGGEATNALAGNLGTSGLNH